MTEIIDRKCSCCKEVITISRDNMDGVIQFQGRYYHYDCFKTVASKRANSKRGKPEMWADALEKINNLEHETKESIKKGFVKEDLNTWLLDHYNVTIIPSRFWQKIAELERGIYNGQRCKPISICDILGTWQWGQMNLNKIHRQQKINGIGPSNDDQRISYDLAIVVSKIPNYLAYKAKMEAQREVQKTNTPRITRDDMQRTVVEKEGLGDISDLLDDDDE